METKTKPQQKRHKASPEDMPATTIAKKPQNKQRRLKVYPKYFHRMLSWSPVIFPEIRLCGKWLQDIGFHHGQTIKVQQEKNKITITLDNETPKDEC